MSSLRGIRLAISYATYYIQKIRLVGMNGVQIWLEKRRFCSSRAIMDDTHMVDTLLRNITQSEN